MTTEDHFRGDLRTNHQRMLAGDLYIADDPEIESRSRRALHLSEQYRRAFLAEDARAAELLRELLGHVGDGVVIRPPLRIDFGEHISVGDRTFVNFNLTALDVAAITIGADCQIGPNVQLLTPTHPVDPDLRRDKLEAAEPITIGDNVWLGGGVVVCPGVTIGADTVVGAGSVVVGDLPGGVVAVGNPARVTRRI